MAVTVRTQTISSSWSRDQIITALETAFSNAGLHGAGLTGLVQGFFDSGTSQQLTHYAPSQGATGGGTHGSVTNDSSGLGNQTDYGNFTFRNIPASGGTGSGVTFDVTYVSGTLDKCLVNNPGSGYTNGDTLTISAANLLGTSNGSANITITAKVDSTTYGSSSTFFQKLGGSTDLYPWAVLKLDKDVSKKYGSTYFFIQVISDTQLGITPLLYWNPTVRSIAGGEGIETAGNVIYTGDSGVVDFSLAPPFGVLDTVKGFGNSNDKNIVTYAIDTSYDITLKTFQAQSPQDTGFALFAFSQASITATDEIQDLVKDGFAFPHWTNSVYDLDHVGDLHFLRFNCPVTTTIEQHVDIIGTHNVGGYSIADALNGWGPAVQSLGNSSESSLNYVGPISTTWGSAKAGQTPGQAVQGIYKRNAAREQLDYGDADSVAGKRGHASGLGYQTAGGYHNLTGRTKHVIIRGIPYLPNLHPSVYTLPDDFVIIEFVYDTPLQKFLPNDTLTVSGSEIYTIVLGAQDISDNDETRAIFLCARTT